jgi:hypothetical protein
MLGQPAVSRHYRRLALEINVAAARSRIRARFFVDGWAQHFQFASNLSTPFAT